MSIALCQNIACFLIAFLPSAIRNLFDLYMRGFCTLNSCSFFAKKRHLNGILGSLGCIFSPFTEFTPLTERFALFVELFMPFLLAFLHLLPSFSHLLPSFLHLLPSLHTFYWAFCTFYWAFTPFAELSRSLLNLHPYRIFLVCTALHVYPCIPRRALCFLYAPFVLFFCVICILRHAICAFSHAICTFSHNICAIFPYY